MESFASSSSDTAIQDNFITIDIHDALSGERKDQIKVEKTFFSPPNKNLLWYYIRWYLSGRRAGTHSTKTVSNVSGSGRKPWPQKHTGRARQGFVRNPHWVGGAVAHGPHPRDYSFKMNKKEKKEALRSAIASKYLEGKLKIVEEINFDVPQTKKATEIIRNLEAYPLILITDGSKKNVFLSFRSVQLSRVLPVDEINAYEILKYDFVVFEKNAFIKILQRYNVKMEVK